MIWEEGIAETDLQSGTAKERKFIRDGLFAIDRTLERWTDVRCGSILHCVLLWLERI